MTEPTALIDAAEKARRQGLLSVAALENLREWLTEPAYEESRADIARLIEQGLWSEIEDSFYKVLEFGTGGRRGPRGVGPNRINARTIAESARGLAEWALQRATPGRTGIAIAHDTRHQSPELARVSAEVIAAMGIPVFYYPEFRPTPQLSFTVRLKSAAAGIVISASHNPRTDNGFKAYGPDGGQLVPPLDAEVLEAVKATLGQPIPRMPFEDAVSAGLITMLGAEEDLAYRRAVLATSRNGFRDTRIVYTPLHGAGIVSVPPVLQEAGFKDIRIVEHQAKPDGDFPYVHNNIPNPEEPAALAEAARMGQELGADLAIGTDPDADRLGCVAPRRNGRDAWQRLSGNQIGAILCRYVLETMQSTGRLRPDHLVLTTTVTSPMLGKIARHYGVGVIEELLVGFKYVACVIESLADPDRVIFACEESHGYLGGPYTRDKDGAGAALLLAEAAAWQRCRSRDLFDLLEETYALVGYHADFMFPHLNPGPTGMEQISRMLVGLRSAPPAGIGGLQVVRIIDRLDGTIRDASGQVIRAFPAICDPVTGVPIEALRPATDNLLIYELAGEGPVGGAKAAIRPSGTEPKVKFYASAWSEPGGASAETRSSVNAVAERILEELRNHALALAGG